MIKKIFFLIISVFFLFAAIAFAEDIRQNLGLWFETDEWVIQNPYYPDHITTDYQAFIHWSPPEQDFCHVDIYENGVQIGSADKNTTSFRFMAFGGGFGSKSEYEDFRSNLLSSTYNCSYKIVASRGCMSLPSIYDEVLTLPPIYPDPIKQTPTKFCTSVGHPINVASGNMFTSHTDISIPARELPLVISRTYNSQDNFIGQFGYGWRSNLDISLKEQADMSVIEVDESGVYTIYKTNYDGSYAVSAGKYSVLTKNSDNSFTILRKHGNKLYFNIRGWLTKIEGRNGNAINISRDANGVILQVTDPVGRSLTFTNDAQGKVTQIADPAGRLVKYAYDLNGNLIQVTDPLNNSFNYQYNGNHQLTVESDPNGHSFYFEYDTDGRAYHSWQEGNNNAVTLSFDTANSKTTVLDSRGNATTYEYNIYGIVTKVTDAQNNIKTSVWDENMNNLSATDENLHTITYTYDARGNLLTSTDPLGNVTTFTYEPIFDFVKTTTDAQNNVATCDYDAKGNLVKLTDALGHFTTSNYDALGQLISTTNPKNSTAAFTYDLYGNPATTTDALGNVTTFTYDVVGNCTQSKDAKNNITQFTYNYLNQLTQITYPDASINTFTYDAKGNKLSVTDNAGYTTTYIYDLDDRLLSITNPLNKTVAFEYDTEGNRTKVIDQNLSGTIYQYDSLNRLISEINPLGLSKSYTYDPAGNRISFTDAKGNVINYEYDPLDRLKKINYPDSSSVSFSYDSLGRRVSMVDTQGTTGYSYDQLSRVTQIDGPKENDTLQYTYDELGNRASLIMPDGKTIQYAYDALSRLSSITDPNNKSTIYSYDEVGNPLNVTYPNNVQATYAFDTLHRLTRLTNQNQGTQIKLSEFVYTYDSAGRRSRIESLDGVTNYTYDPLGELVDEIRSSVSNSYQISYQYDSTGNRTRMLKDNVEHLYTYNSANQLIQEDVPGATTTPITVTGTVSDANGIQSLTVNEVNSTLSGNNFTCQINLSPGLNPITVTATDVSGNTATKTINVTCDQTDQTIYLYDNNGNLIRKQSPAQELNLSYDYENRLTGAITNGSQTIYVYDGEGRRITSASGSTTTKYLYDGQNVIRELDAVGNTVTEYLRNPYAAGGIGGIINSQVKSPQPVPEVYYSYDGLGSVASLSDSVGVSVQSYSYDAFGNAQGPETNTRQFLTKETDPTGLIYFSARYYDPKIGRFITQDPKGMIDGPNMYLYCFNDPVNMVDLWGLECKDNSLWNRTLGSLWAAIIAYFNTPVSSSSLIEDDRLIRNLVIGVSGGIKLGGFRYVGLEEAAIVAKTGFVPNVNKSGIFKSVFYTPDKAITSASKAQKIYNLPTKPTHRISLNTKEITNIYGGNGQGIKGIEMITYDKIRALKIHKLKE